MSDKTYSSIGVGLGTGVSLAFILVAVIFVVLKTRRRKPSIQNGTCNIHMDIRDFYLFMQTNH